MAPLTTTDEIEDRLALVDEAIAAHDATANGRVA